MPVLGRLIKAHLYQLPVLIATPVPFHKVDPELYLRVSS